MLNRKNLCMVLSVALAAATLRLSLASAAEPATNCSGLAGNDDYQNSLRARLRDREVVCRSSGPVYRELFARADQKIHACRRIAHFIGSPWDPATYDNFGNRFDSACGAYIGYVDTQRALCRRYSDELEKQGRLSAPTAANDVAALKRVHAAYGRAQCTYFLLEKAAKASEGIAGAPPDRSSQAPPAAFTDEKIAKLKNSLVDSVRALQEPTKKKAAQLIANPSYSRRAILELHTLSAQCQSATEELTLLERTFQKSIYQELIRMHKDATRAKSFFAQKKNAFASMQTEIQGRIGEMDTAGSTIDKKNPTRVRHAPDDPNAALEEFCMPDTELSSVERSLSESVLALEGEDGRYGTSFLARTTDASGNPVYREVTAAHATMENLHDPENEKMIGIKTAPAGHSASEGDTKVFENNSDDLDRKRDISMRSAGFGPALPVKSDAELPREGQEFLLAGHPGYTYGGSYVNMTCKFLGYGTGERDGDYVLDCPAGNSSLGGLSGGPMVHPGTGEVWGVATNQGHFLDPKGNYLYSDNRVFVSPIQQGANGRILTGPQSHAGSASCYLIRGSIPHPCYVTPMGILFE